MVLDTGFHICFIMTLLQNATNMLLQNATEVFCKMRQVFYYKMRQFYYKMRQLLQIVTILLQNAKVITKCDVYDKLRQFKQLFHRTANFLFLQTLSKRQLV